MHANVLNMKIIIVILHQTFPIIYLERVYVYY